MKILFVAPHPDDETLGCGGTILRHKFLGDKIYWLIITNVFIKEGFSEDTVKQRQKEIDKVSRMYGFEKTFKLDYPTAKLDKYPILEVISKIKEILNQIKPEIVYLPNGNDSHTDHQIVFKAISASVKSFRCPFLKKALAYECVSETEFAIQGQNEVFIPNIFVDISKYINMKIEIMKIYRGELKRHPFPRSSKNIKALATFRGATMGSKYAESFMLIWEYLK